MSNYEGPCVVKKALPRGVLILTRMNGEELPLLVNSNAVKMFYAWYDYVMIEFFVLNVFWMMSTKSLYFSMIPLWNVKFHFFSYSGVIEKVYTMGFSLRALQKIKKI